VRSRRCADLSHLPSFLRPDGQEGIEDLFDDHFAGTGPDEECRISSIGRRSAMNNRGSSISRERWLPQVSGAEGVAERAFSPFKFP
jgi:hypothetical protein